MDSVDGATDSDTAKHRNHRTAPGEWLCSRPLRTPSPCLPRGLVECLLLIPISQTGKRRDHSVPPASSADSPHVVVPPPPPPSRFTEEMRAGGGEQAGYAGAGHLQS